MICKNDAFMKKVGVEKLNDKVEVDFDVQRFLPDCRRIKADKYVSTAATSPSFNMYRIPSNQFECYSPNCVNSGTLYNEGKKTVYKLRDGQDFANGVITFYVTEGVTSAEVLISDTAAGTNGDKYTVTPGAAVGGFKAVVVDLTQAGTAVGSGWTPSDDYAYITITLTGSNAGLSSIAVFDDLEDFQTSTHVKAACVTSVDGSWDLDVAENACFPNNYSETANRSFEKTVTFTKVTANHWRLNPMYKRGTATQGFDIVTVERTVKADGNYGKVVIDDMNQDECRFFSVQLADMCVVGDSQLEKLNIPMNITLDMKHYVLVDAGNGVTNLIVNNEHVGKSVLISYPRLVDVEEFVLTDSDINDLRTSMSYVKRYTDGYKYRFTFNKVLVTSFSDTLSEDENEFTVTLSIQKDEKGNYGYAHRIVDDGLYGSPRA